MQLGTGPIEQLAMRHLRGELDLATACKLAQHASVTGILTDDYVGMICGFAVDQASNNRVVPARALIQIMLAATEVLPDSEEYHFIKSAAELNWVNAIGVSISDDPNWDDVTSAKAIAETTLHRARRRNDRLLEYSLLRALGALSIDSLVAHQPDFGGFKARWKHWYARGDQASTSGSSFPPPEHALQAGYDYFERAAALYDDSKRGIALKGCVQALEWLSRADGKKRDEQIQRLAQEALPLLDPSEHMPGITYLMGMLRETGASTSSAIRSLATTDVDALVERVGPVAATVSLGNVIALLRTEDSKLALELAARADAVAQSTDDAALIGGFLNNWLMVLVESLSEGKVDNSAGTLTTGKRTVEKALRENWPQSRLAGALLGLASTSGPRDEEVEGLELVSTAEQLMPDIFVRYQRPLDYLRQTLWGGAGAVLFNKGERAQAAHCYANAIHFSLLLEQRVACITFLEYLLDTCLHVDDDQLVDLLIMLYSLAPRVEAQLGAEGILRIQSFGQVVTQVQCEAGDINAELLHLTWQIAKGSRFSAAVRVHAGPGVPKDDASDALLEQTANMRTLVPLHAEGTGRNSRIDRDLRLLAFVSEEIPATGSTPIARLTNLQHRFDRWLDRRLLTSGNPAMLRPHPLSQIQEALDERTILLNLFLGPFGDGHARYALIAGREYVNAHVIPNASGLFMEVKEAGYKDVAYSMALDAFAWRQSLTGEHLNLEAFESGCLWAKQFVLGGLATILAELARKGFDHLCVMPHGPLHYLPLQLLPIGAGIVADHWTVTSLPSTELLRREAPGTARTGLAAFGVSFTENNPYALDQLPEAADEARRIAATFGARASLDDDATEESVRTALNTARYVHIATHGALNLDAPAFQYLVLTPTADSDGILYAHELLDCDLRGLELVTLSACETALGRFDQGDNPRGLPAMLLLAGAQTVIGSLWTVRSAVARVFFVHLYQQLFSGASRRQAFRDAQIETRRRFPGPEDWAAFYYLGT